MKIERRFPDSEADVSMGEFKLWVDRRGHPEATDYWDGNWLVITAAFITKYCVVYCEGNILHGSDVAHSLDAARQMHESLEGKFAFSTLDPGFELEFSALRQGQIDLSVRFVPVNTKVRMSIARASASTNHTFPL